MTFRSMPARAPIWILAAIAGFSLTSYVQVTLQSSSRCSEQTLAAVMGGSIPIPFTKCDGATPCNPQYGCVPDNGLWVYEYSNWQYTCAAWALSSCSNGIISKCVKRYFSDSRCTNYMFDLERRVNVCGGDYHDPPPPA